MESEPDAAAAAAAAAAAVASAERLRDAMIGNNPALAEVLRLESLQTMVDSLHRHMTALDVAYYEDRLCSEKDVVRVLMDILTNCDFERLVQPICAVLSKVAPVLLPDDEHIAETVRVICEDLGGVGTSRTEAERRESFIRYVLRQVIRDDDPLCGRATRELARLGAKLRADDPDVLRLLESAKLHGRLDALACLWRNNVIVSSNECDWGKAMLDAGLLDTALLRLREDPKDDGAFFMLYAMFFASSDAEHDRVCAEPGLLELALNFVLDTDPAKQLTYFASSLILHMTNYRQCNIERIRAHAVGREVSIATFMQKALAVAETAETDDALQWRTRIRLQLVASLCRWIPEIRRGIVDFDDGSLVRSLVRSLARDLLDHGVSFSILANLSYDDSCVCALRALECFDNVVMRLRALLDDDGFRVVCAVNMLYSLGIEPASTVDIMLRYLDQYARAGDVGLRPTEEEVRMTRRFVESVTSAPVVVPASYLALFERMRADGIIEDIPASVTFE